MSAEPELYPIVLRLAEFFPASLSRIQMHALRKEKDVDHVELGFTSRNRTYVGAEFAKSVKAEIKTMMRDNRREEAAALRRARHKALAEQREEDGFLPPFRDSKGGPLREAVLTASLAYFAAGPEVPDEDIMITCSLDEDEMPVENRLSKAKIAAFERRGLEFFDAHFPGAVRHLRLDLDESVPHFHAVLVQTVEKTSTRRGKQVLIQPSANPLIADYEHAQDVAGSFFAPLGLMRGERRAQARAEAREAGLPLPDARKHVTPREFRAARAQKIKDKEAEIARRDVASKSALVDATLERGDARRKRKAADDMIERAEGEEASVEAMKAAIVAGLDAIEAGQLEYVPPAGGRAEGLRLGAGAPMQKSAREALKALIGPARDWVLQIAARVASIAERAA